MMWCTEYSIYLFTCDFDGAVVVEDDDQVTAGQDMQVVRDKDDRFLSRLQLLFDTTTEDMFSNLHTQYYILYK